MKRNGDKIEEYSISIYYSPEDKCYVADVLEFDGHCMAHGDTREEALREINIAIKGWLKTDRQSKIEIPVPFSRRKYSGKLTLRLTPAKHRQLEMAARQQGTSLNRYIAQKI